jgi:Tol biopolymer transport system component
MQRLILLAILVMALLSACAQADQQITPIEPLITTSAQETTSVGSSTISPIPSSTPEPTNTKEPTPATVVPSETPTAEPETTPFWVVYTGNDENIWLVDPTTGENRQITKDAVSLQSSMQSGELAVRYCCVSWSPDGQQLIFQRETSKPIQSGFETSFDLLLYEISSGKITILIENEQISGYAWRPGGITIAYGRSIPIEYFINRSPDTAQGIWAVNAETGETLELVKPERGFSLSNPQWSPDGRFLSFEEVQGMEGRGLFAYYDFKNQEYIAWDDIIGSYDWSPAGEQIAYDRLAYVPQGGERIWLRDRQEEEERAVSQQLDPGYAFSPKLSPDGDQLAYMAELKGPESQEVTIFVQKIPDGEPKNLGTFKQAGYLSWASDGTALLLTAGDYDKRQILMLNPITSESSVLAQGTQADWQPILAP